MESEVINYPDEGVYNSSKGSNYDYIILWMLNNNESCSWSQLTNVIAESTLYEHLTKLKELGYISHPKRNLYRITSSQGVWLFNLPTPWPDCYRFMYCVLDYLARQSSYCPHCRVSGAGLFSEFCLSRSWAVHRRNIRSAAV